MQGSEVLTYLELSGCRLRGSHLVLIAEKLLETRDTLPLGTLDLSGNFVSDLIEENQVK